MIGIMHSLFIDFIRKNLGEETVTKVLKEAGLPPGTIFRMDTGYPDDEWRCLHAAAMKVTGLDPDQAETAFARFAGEEIVVKMAGFFTGCKSAKDILLRQPTIHKSLASGITDATRRQLIQGKFLIDDLGEEIVTHYKSPNNHCTVYRALTNWMGEYYHEKLEVSEPRCQKRGDSECEIHVKFLGKS